MPRTLIIAEAGVNHGGDLERGLELVKAAAAAGADVVKFQSFKTDLCISRAAPLAAYQKAGAGAAKSQYDLVRQLELDRASHLALKECADRSGLRFNSTAFDPESLALLIEMNVDFLKVPSGEITNLPFLRLIARQGLPVILSTGMARLDEVASALSVLVQSGLDKDSITILHCNTEYPTPPEDVNLRAMLTVREEFDVAVGYSDHTLGIEVPIAAVALGAKVIEKHFTLDRNLPGPDHKASLVPEELKQMVDSIRNIERALGDGVKRPSNSELKNIDIARRSIVAAKAIKQGEAFNDENLTAKRPGTGVSPMRWDEFIGKRADRDYEADELIAE